MKIDNGLMKQIASDLGLNVRFEKGSTIPVKNCWHFMTDGNAVDVLFRENDDFRFAMNLIFLLTGCFKVTVLAFIIMDTHVHFVLYGDFDQCNRMMHEYIRRVSIYLAKRYDIHNLFSKDPIQYQVIDDDIYLKTVICYVIKNATVAGLPFNALDYPWSSGTLYFKCRGYWNSSRDEYNIVEKRLSIRQMNQLFHSGYYPNELKVLRKEIRLIENIVFPGEYVAWEIVERIFRTHRGFNYFLCKVKESDVDSRNGVVSYLSIPIQEMQQHKKEMCKELFGVETVKTLDTGQRLRLAKALRSKYNSSKKQIIRLCGLVYSEAENLL